MLSMGSNTIDKGHGETPIRNDFQTVISRKSHVSQLYWRSKN